MKPTLIASREDWLSARKALLEQEKELTRRKDEITRLRQSLPWVPLEKSYVFQSENGEVSLEDLFEGREQLIIYHFMFGPKWKAGCVSCSFWADGFNGLDPHLAARDIAFAVVSSAPMSMITPFKERMDWDFTWVSSNGTGFNRDFDVGFPEDMPADEPIIYNFRQLEKAPHDEMPGVSVFAKGEDGTIYHTYSAYSRGLDSTNAAYTFMDLTPMGRNEPTSGNPMAWVRHHDAY
ncbi:DUF899 domain-containing protein [Pseudovibrio brasiliensis]|uniref:DUF899 domain-containing protein n=1 Tax=Pseudovibrio brasiliensis TaxID=1898042 RepID=A0ABX8ATJ9_9HYPH|nr:thioredoxin family protein [Pseudovibrio brasiliensis]QUS58444.1 DUF899 domain-containing protein [Pseudovibrio brasiliensis]